MNILKLILFLILPLSCFIHITTSIVNCPPPSFCGDLSFPIKYPFQLINNNPQQKSNGSDYCTYPPGFSLTCDPQSKLSLYIPYFGNLYVKDISYVDRRIYLADPNNCFPTRLLVDTMNLLSTPFVATYYEDYNLFICPPDVFKYGQYATIPCLSNSSFSVVAAKNSSSSLMYNFYNCNVSWTLSEVPGLRYNQFYGSSFDEIVLTWYDFTTCGIYCTSINPSTKPASTGNTSKESISFLIFIMPFAVMAMVAIIIVMCKSSHNNISSVDGAASQNITTTNHQDLTNPSTAVIRGLEDSMIELCSAKVIIGESFRELVTSDYHSSICAICLSDFSTNEAIRCIIECQHYFHTECIDEWLRIKGMCPVCRNNLLP